jgi:hydrogenase maturation protease
MTARSAVGPVRALDSLRPRVRLIVCGEPERGDDAAGPRAVEGLPAGVLRLVEQHRTTALDVDTLLGVPEGVACVLVDAAVGIEPGRVVVMPLERLLVRAHDGAIPRSSHELPVEQVIGLAAILRGELPAGSFVGLGAAACGLGAPLSPSVEAALPEFRAAIATEIRRLATGHGTMTDDGHDPGSLRRVGRPLSDLVGAGPGTDGARPAGPPRPGER